MPRVTSAEADSILDKEYPVLDHGFVRLVDYLGGDNRIVAAARVSYGSGTKTVREDRKLIHYLIHHGHMSPFEQVVMTFHVKLPIFVARQWIRHRTARVNEMSGRYSVMKEEFYLPKPEDIRRQSLQNRQGRGKEVSDEQKKKVIDLLRQHQSLAYHSYEDLLREDIARELARINLPLSAYTQWYWQIDLRNLFNFLKLRLDLHAQYEIRVYAQVISDMAKAVAPVAWEAFNEHILHAVVLQKSTIDRLIKYLEGISGTSQEAKELMDIVIGKNESW